VVVEEIEHLGHITHVDAEADGAGRLDEAGSIQMLGEQTLTN